MKEFGTAFVFVALFVVAGFGSCVYVLRTGPEKARATLEKSGYTDVVVLDQDYLAGCAESDAVNRRFRARNPAGKVVEGRVCCGAFLKDCTVRF
jgi:hypothetical protein